MAGIFKSYDIRGTYPDEVNDEIAYKIGRAVVSLTKAKTVVVGNDMRVSSPKIFEALSRGITTQGADVIDIGMCTTPMVYFASGKYGYDSAVMITASHNPPEYNGFKLCRRDAVPISYETGINEIEKLVSKDQLVDSNVKGKVMKKEIFDEYKSFILAGKEKLGYKVVVDTANAMGVLEEDILKGVCDIVALYPELDGSCPNHEANPLKPENMVELQKSVVEEKADLGIAYDGDADRVMFVDEKGEILRADLVTALIAGLYKNETILFDVRSSWAVEEEILKNSNRAVRCRVGHALIKKQMRDEKAIFAGELSGHYYFRDTFYAESSTKAAIMVMEMMKNSGKKLSELIKPLNRFYATGEINSEVKDKDAKIEEIGQLYKDGNISRLDGISVEYDDWWFNVRKSNTEPLLRLNLEAKTEKMMEEKRDEVLKVIRS
jgi:phosphomannomutase